MNIQKIKERANQVFEMNKAQYIRILIILILLGLIPGLFNTGQSSLLYAIISLVFLTLSHGYVVSSLKMVRNQAHLLSDDDAFVGFKRIKELFSTYLLNNIIMVLILFVSIFIIFMILGLFVSELDPEIMSNILISSGQYTQTIIQLFQKAPSLIAVMMLCYLVLLVLVFVISAYMFAVPYLLEQYHMKNLQAIKESYRLMKGHIWDFIKLNLSFLGWMIGILVLQLLIEEALIFLPIFGSLVAAIVAGLIGIYTYVPRYYLSRTIFFEELAYHRYEYKNDFGDESYV